MCHGRKVINKILEGLVKWEQRTKKRGATHLTVRKWELQKHQSCGMPVEGFLDHVTTDGSLVAGSGRWSACRWSVVQLDHDNEIGPMHGMYGTFIAELEEKRTIKRAGLTAFLCLFRKVIGPTTVHVDNKGWAEFIRKAYCWRWNTSKRIDQRRKSNTCRSSLNLSLKETKRRTNWHKMEH